MTAPAASDGLLDSLTEVVFRTDAAGMWTYLNPAWTTLTGLPVTQTLGTNFLDYVHPDERDHTLALFMAIVTGGGRYCHHQTRYGTAGGGYRWVDLRATVLTDAAGNLVANVGTITDITDERASKDRVVGHADALEVIADTAAQTDLAVAVATFATDFTLVGVSDALRRMLGMSLTVGTNLVRALQPAEASRNHDGRLAGRWGMLDTARRTGSPQHSEVSLVRPDDGRTVILQVSVVPLIATAPAAFALVAHDITGLRRAERQQSALADLGRRSLAGEAVRALLDAAAAAVSDVLGTALAEVFEVTPDGGTLLPRVAVGWPGGTADLASAPTDPGTSVVAAPLLAPGAVVVVDLAAADLTLEPWLVRKSAVSSLGVRIGSPGEPFGVLLTQTLTTRRFTADECDFLQGLAHILATAVQRTRDEERIRQQSLHDPLTGLANRVLLQDHLSLALRAARRGGHRVALLLMDLDRFKEINDTLGHEVGDQALQRIAARLGGAVRASDTVARLGGDEFAVVLPIVADAADAMAVAAKLAAVTEDRIELAGVALRVEVSIGVAVFPEDGGEPVQLLKRADVAMYHAKSLSTQVATYSASADQNRPERLRYLAALQRGIAENELVVEYQPRVDLRTGLTTGAEALVRWQHPGEGLLAPLLFVPLAEQTGLIRPLTWRVLDLSLRQTARWRADGRPIPVAVNVSARMLHQNDLLSHVMAALRTHDVPPEDLTIEVTESAMMSNPDSGLAAVGRLRAEGVRVSVDDFGTGHSSLAYLRDLPVNELKVDRSFIAEVTRDPRSASIVGTIVDLGHTLSLRVVAEGIEDAATCDLLRSLGCDEGQGYHLGRPGPPESVVARDRGQASSSR